MAVRTVPPWVEVLDEPPPAFVLDGPDQRTSRWKAYIDASLLPQHEKGMRVSPQWWVDNGPDYYKRSEEDAKGSRSTSLPWIKRTRRTVLRSPIIPLLLRSVVWMFSVVALGLAASIHRLTNAEDKTKNLASTDLAIAIDGVAILYLSYITYDEFTSKPLGLRSPMAKMRLILLDLFFIVFESANLSLAFDAVNHGGVVLPEGTEDYKVKAINHRQDALVSVLLVALIAWVLTFCISVMR
ncbi:MAG: hypothetical protein Q9220_006316 [cf. Caloplaca sp. 1 TL-2023]